MRRIAFPIYLLALAIVLVIGMGGYVTKSSCGSSSSRRHGNARSETSWRPRNWR
jgi:uncharacterized protein (UPF0333 family)